MKTVDPAVREPVDRFKSQLATSLKEGTFVRLVMSRAKNDPRTPSRILGRSIELHGKPCLSLTLRYPTQDQVKNFPPEEGVAWIATQLGAGFQNALLGTTEGDWQLSLSPTAARLQRHKPATTVVPSRHHDQARRSTLDDSAQDWLTALRITDPSGRVRPGMSGKFTQIHRYLEILAHLGRDCGWAEPGASADAGEWTLADMGCGKGYLTFGLWHLFRRQWKLPVRIVGVEVRPELVEASNQVAQRIPASGLEFVTGTIASLSLPRLRGLIALHACNTATDDAILRGIGLGAQLVVVAPCCHQQVRPQLGRPAPLDSVLRHGLMQERLAEWLTDGLRSLYLEWAGYDTKLIEFVASEHTPKNLMIAAMRQQPAFSNAQARRRIEDLKSFFGIQEHALDSLLAQSPAQPG